MHDVGKIGIPDRVLLKPAKLDDNEWNIMRSHCYIGYKIIGDHPSELLKTAAVAAFTHQEKWDGSGYPPAIEAREHPPDRRQTLQKGVAGGGCGCGNSKAKAAVTSTRHWLRRFPN